MSYPPIVYKYRDWVDENHKNVLIKNQLFLASPKACNDPFDCRVAPDFSLLDTEQKKKEKVNQLVIENFTQLLREGKDIESELKKLDKKFTNIISTQREYEDYYFSAQDLHYGILSLSARWNSILMWSHYSKNHSGYCVGFHEQKIRESKLFGMGGSVSYTDDFPRINPLDEKGNIFNIFQETYVKAKDWCYEKEYRLTFNFYPDIPKIEDRIVEIPDDFFAEVVIGLMADINTEREIIEICRDKQIEVYKLFKVPNKFELRREKI